MEFRSKIIIDIYNKLKWVQPELILKEELRMVINDIRKYIRQNEDDFEMNQGLIGIKYLFWGFVIKV